MSPRIVVLQHEPETGLGRFERLLDAADVVYDVVAPIREPLPDAAALDGVIALGGSLEPHDATLLPLKQWIACANAELPYLGIGLGAHVLAEACGARIRRSRPELGTHDVFLTDAARFDPLFCDLPGRFQIFGWHANSFELPRGALPLAGSLACTYQASRFRSSYGVQFRPEVRVDDLELWQQLPENRRLLAGSGREWSDVAVELERAAPQMDWLAAELLGRWLALVAAGAFRTANSRLRPRLEPRPLASCCDRRETLLHMQTNRCMRTWIESGRGNHCLRCFIGVAADSPPTPSRQRSLAGRRRRVNTAAHGERGDVRWRRRPFGRLESDPAANQAAPRWQSRGFAARGHVIRTRRCHTR